MKLLLPFLLATLATSASATGVVLTFDASRCYTGPTLQYYLTGNAMLGPYNALITDGWTVQQTSLITPAVLQGATIFVTGQLDLGTTLSQSESAALQNWVAAGGGVLYMGEGDVAAPANTQFGALFNGPHYGGQDGQIIVSETIVAPLHPLIHGPGGTVTALPGFSGPGRWIDLPAVSADIIHNPDGSSSVVAQGYGAGRVVFLSDSAYFAVPGYYDLNREALWRNTIAWLATPMNAVTSFCSGDGSAAACPCGNPGAPGAGCANSLGVRALLTGNGTASIGNDSFVLNGSGMPNSSALYFQGTTRVNAGLGAAFGDGLRCAGGASIRLGTKLNSGGASSYPGPGDAHISVRGACTSGATRTYQVWYRNAAPFCTPSTFNLSNGIEVTWIQ